jgi:hypothetical protein
MNDPEETTTPAVAPAAPAPASQPTTPAVAAAPAPAAATPPAGIPPLIPSPAAIAAALGGPMIPMRVGRPSAPPPPRFGPATAAPGTGGTFAGTPPETLQARQAIAELRSIFGHIFRMADDAARRAPALLASLEAADPNGLQCQAEGFDPAEIRRALDVLATARAE